MFNGTQPSDERCTTIPGQSAIKCGQGAMLLNCISGFNDGNFSDLSTWNKIGSPAGVSILFTFDRQIRINEIRMYFWNSPNNGIKVPNVRAFWSDDNVARPLNEISLTQTTIDGNSTLSIGGTLKFKYLRILLSFNNDQEWIFLSEVKFCGKHTHTVIATELLT